MKLFYILLLLVATALPPAAFAGYHRQDQPLSPAPGSQQFFPERQSVAAASATSATYIISSTGSPSGSGLNVTTFAHQPDVPRNITVTPAGTTADVTACTVTVNGTNIFGATISETFAITATQSTATTGNKAFKTVTSVSIPAACETGSNADTAWHVGTGSKVGLDRCLDNASDFLHAGLGGVKETTAPTVAVSSTAVESNTATLNSSLNGSTVQLYFFHNYRCLHK